MVPEPRTLKSKSYEKEGNEDILVKNHPIFKIYLIGDQKWFELCF